MCCAFMEPTLLRHMFRESLQYLDIDWQKFGGLKKKNTTAEKQVSRSSALWRGPANVFEDLMCSI